MMNALRAWWTKTDRMKELKKINLGYLLLSTLFYYSTVWEDIEWLCYLPVSYTHLDVYKRQIY